MIVRSTPDDVLPYTEDPSNLSGTPPVRVFVPETVAEVAPVVAEAYASRTSLTVSGGGTGIVGGRVPRGGWTLSTERLQDIRKIFLEEKKVEVDAGMPVSALLEALSASSLFYPPFPTEKTAFIGGTIATNASGEYTYRFGPTRAYVRALELVLANGTPLRTARGEYVIENGRCILPGLPGELHTAFRSRNLPKNSCGYFMRDTTDLVDLIIGSEGTLAVITGAELDVIPAPAEPLFCVVFLREETAFELSGALRNAAFEPSILGIEYFDGNSLRLLAEKHRVPQNASEALLVMFDVADEALFDDLEPLLERPDVIETWASDDNASREKIYAFRHALPETVNERVKSMGLVKLSSDIAVPRDRAEEMFRFYRDVLGTADMRYVLFGHMGEDHLHVNFLPAPGLRDNAEALYRRLLEKAVALGGTISAEHGIGKKKVPYLPLMYSAGELREMKRIKDYFDPAGILCPGNLF